MHAIDFPLALLGQTLLRGSAWLLLIALIAVCLRGASAAHRTLLWRTAFAGLVLLPACLLFTPPLPILDAPRQAQPAIEAVAQAPPMTLPRFTSSDRRAGQIKMPDSPQGQHTVAQSEQPGADSKPEPAAVTVRPALPARTLVSGRQAPGISDGLRLRPGIGLVKALLLAVWSAGAAWSLLGLAFSLFALVRLRRLTIDAPPEMQSEVTDYAKRAGLRRRVSLRSAGPQCPIYAPITWGAVRPVVVMPSEYTDATAARRRAALLHELAHAMRQDWAWQVFAQIVCALYWCVPFVWLAARQLRRETELACDDCVLTAGVPAPDYAAQILETARTLKARSGRLPAGALTMARPPLAESRIRAILDPHRRRHTASRLLLAAAVLASAICPVLFSLRAVAASKRTEKPRWLDSSLDLAVPSLSAPGNAIIADPSGAAGLATVAPPRSQWQPYSGFPGEWWPIGSASGWDPAGAVFTSVRPGSLAAGLWRRGSNTGLLMGGGAVPNAATSRTGLRNWAPGAAIVGTDEPDTDALRNSGEVFLTNDSGATRPAGSVIHWGPALHGLQNGLSVRGNRKVFRFGETVSMDLYWRNASKTPVRVRYAWYTRHEFVPDLETLHGKRIDMSYTMIDIPPIVTGVTLKPREAVWAASPTLLLLREKRPESEIMAVVEPGTYRLRQTNSVSRYDKPASPGVAPDWIAPVSGWVNFEVVEDANPQAGNGARSEQPRMASDGRNRFPLKSGYADTAHTRQPDLAAPDRSAIQDGKNSGGGRADAAEARINGIAWGPEVDGLQAGLRLVAPRTTYAPGEVIWQEAYLRNRSKQEVVITASGGYEEQGAPVISGARGTTIKVLRYFGMGAMFTVSTHVRPGELTRVGRFAVTFLQAEKGSDPPHEVAPGLSLSAEGTALALAGPGAYRLRQELAPYSVDNKLLSRKLQTGTISIRVEGPQAPTIGRDRNEIADISTAKIAWGPEHSGLQAGLIALDSKAHYYIGERVQLAVILRNVSTKPIPLWHETSFAFLEAPYMLDAAGKRRSVKLMPEPEWKTLSAVRITGVTYDMTFAPSADGPSRLRRSEIGPGQAVLGYYLTAFVVPAKWTDGHSAPGRCRIVQPVRLGLDTVERLDTLLETGPLNVEILDPDARAASPAG